MDDIVERLREHATDWNGEQMPDLEPAKGDPTAGTLRYAADAIESLRAENARLTAERGALAEASAYLIDRLTKVSGGIVVRDLEEARGSYDAALAKVKGGLDAR